MIRQLLSVSHHDFSFFETRKAFDIYEDVSTIYNTTADSNYNFKKLTSKKPVGLHRIYYIPHYFKLKVNKQSAFDKIELPEIDKGLLINLSGYASVTKYLEFKFSSKKRKKFNLAFKKLESSHNISYKTFYGEIDRGVYDLLMDRLLFLIQSRFDQKDAIHVALSNWNFYKESVFEMVLKKNASIFVIYDEDEPINICISYHFQNVTFSSIKSYDINYSKFSLGSLDIIKRLDWGLVNGFNIFDFYRGILPHKLEWANEIYKFKHHIFYKKNSFANYVLANLLRLYIKSRARLYRLKHTEMKQNNFEKITEI